MFLPRLAWCWKSLCVRWGEGELYVKSLDPTSPFQRFSFTNLVGEGGKCFLWMGKFRKPCFSISGIISFWCPMNHTCLVSNDWWCWWTHLTLKYKVKGCKMFPVILKRSIWYMMLTCFNQQDCSRRQFYRNYELIWTQKNTKKIQIRLTYNTAVTISNLNSQ